MPSIYLEDPLSEEATHALRQEFPHYSLFSSCEGEGWKQVEILYGNQLSEGELEKAPRLRWIHSPTMDLEGLCFDEILKKENIIVTASKGDYAEQTAEFVMGAIFAFAKQLFHWKEVSSVPADLWHSSIRHTQWTLSGKTLLQVGVGEVGTEIVKQAQLLGLTTWGVRRTQSFHPFCDKVFALDQLHSLLPACDIIVVALPKGAVKKILFSAPEFHNVKKDSIFIVTETAENIDEAALAEAAKAGIFRGILLDAFNQTPLPKDSPLWNLPQVILTPAASHFPHLPTHSPFLLFRRNLRLYVTGRLKEMKNMISAK